MTQRTVDSFPRTVPPGSTTRLEAARVLVVAPHYDDEVLGCGGLLLQLQRQGVAPHIVFVSDSARLPEGPSRTYAAARHAESIEVLDRLGAQGRRELGYPDGQLEFHIAEVAAALAEAIAEWRPELLLVPGPDEVSADHRATFDAATRALRALGGDPQHRALLGALRWLSYEVNHPGPVDLLVDVSDVVEPLRRLIELYPGQLRQHDYGRAALGLRAFRTLTLPPEVVAAEAYRCWALPESPESPAASSVPVAGARQPKVSVIVRTCDRPVLFAQAMASLAGSTVAPAEVVVVSAGAAPDLAGISVPVKLVEVAPGSRGAAADAGLRAATGDCVTFLDDDDLYRPRHLELLAEAVEGGADAAYSRAAIGTYAAAGADRLECRDHSTRPFDRDLLMLDNYIPLICLIVNRQLALDAGGFDIELNAFEDWDFLLRLSSLTDLTFVDEVTCEYRHFLSGHDHALAGAASRGDDQLMLRQRVVGKHLPDLSAASLSRGARLMADELALAREDIEVLKRRVTAAATPAQALAARLWRRARIWARSRSVWRRR
jgi:LmbE family N-acetylglucosaminyl deacetylase